MSHAIPALLDRIREGGSEDCKNCIDELSTLLTQFEHRAQKVVDAVTYDDSGIMGKGGNGGLLSRETIRSVDELRALMRTL